MKNNKWDIWRWCCLAGVILSGVYLLYTRFRGWIWLLTHKSASRSIGIIGGADGPTAIFVTGNLNWQPGKIIAFVLLCLGIIGFIVFSKLKRK